MPSLPEVPPYLDDIASDEVNAHRCVRFDMKPRLFLIDLKRYSASRIDHKMKLDDVEEWEVRNYSDVDHPFHIHVNPFQVFERNGRSVPLRWHDVVNVPGLENAKLETGSDDLEYGSVKFRMKIRTFTGKFVLHCHILFHEDNGMMQLVEVTVNESNAAERNDCAAHAP